jgi:enamine deaminase RidA (YjgF/YER057c/UK114 family)
MRDVIPAPVPGLDLCREYGHHQSPAIRAGGLIFCSGMVAINPESGERQHGTVTSEPRCIFENLKLLLESAGSSLDRIVQVHALIYDRIEYDVLNRAYRQYVPNAPPARTVMSVQIEAGQGHARRNRRGGNASGCGHNAFETGDQTPQTEW